MYNFNSNQFTNSVSKASIGSVEQKAAQLKQNQKQVTLQNVQNYVQNAQPNAYANSVEQKAKQLMEQNAKNYIQQMNSKIGLF